MLRPSSVRPRVFLRGDSGGALGTDAFEQILGRFVGRILIDEFALEGPLENGLTETSRNVVRSLAECNSIASATGQQTVSLDRRCDPAPVTVEAGNGISVFEVGPRDASLTGGRARPTLDETPTLAGVDGPAST